MADDLSADDLSADDLSVVLVSNRGPVSFVDSEGTRELRRGAGGLAGALDPVARRLGDRALWIAAATSDEDRAALHDGDVDKLRDELGYPVRLLDVPPDLYGIYYDDVSNRLLWFANHCLWDDVDAEPDAAVDEQRWRDAYVKVNRMFADEVVATAVPDAAILFQDYHLSVAPALVRAQRPEQTIFHFTHSSFCSPGLARLSETIRRDVVEGMLAADLVGFHTHAWVEEFFDACEGAGATVDPSRGAVLHDGRTTWVRAYPITIDVRQIRERAMTEDVRSWVERFRSDDRTLIVRADRTEPSKNIVRGFEAFAAMLDARPDLADRVRFVACLYPSRQSMPEYEAHMDAIRASVANVQARYPGTLELYLKDDYDRTLGALCAYDVLLVNSLMDGMNLVAKEGPAINERGGVLVLSRTAGSFEELGDDAVVIDDPRDTEATVKALIEAVEMPDQDRHRRRRALRSIVEATTPNDWIEAQLRDLRSLRVDGRPASDL